MSYELSESAYSQLCQTRDAIRLFKHTSMATEPGTQLDAYLLANYLTLMDEQLSLVLDDATGAFPQDQPR